MEFHNKTAIITGGASGIGFLSAKCLAKEGANVLLVDINEAHLVDFILYLASDKAAFITGSNHFIDGGRIAMTRG